MHIRNQDLNYIFFLMGEGGEGVGVGVVYNKLLLKHLWSCVLKLVSELHDFI